VTWTLTLPRDVTKEIRALLPTWLACAVVLALVAVLDQPRAYVAGVLACGFGAIALGALSTGHEYTHRTLTLLLSQPSSRARIFLVKFGVLTGMLLMLGTLAFGVLSNPAELNAAFADYWKLNWARSTVLFLPLLCGLCVAPLLTMLCRNPLAGVVFTTVVPASMWVVSKAFALTQYGWIATDAPDIDGFTRTVFWWGMVGFCMVAALFDWLVFMRLEAIDGRDPEMHRPRWLGGRATTLTAVAADDARQTRDGHPLWLLAKKELRLQQMTIVIAALYTAGWVLVSALAYMVPGWDEPPLAAVSVLYGALLALLIGSLASAEERHFGTLEWQLLLPLASGTQWIVKAGVTLGMAMLLSFALPALLSVGDMRPNPVHAGVIILLTTGSLYVSSLCTSGLRALVLSVAIVFGVTVLVGFLFSARVAAPDLFDGRWPWIFVTVLVTGVLALALRFALENHRSAKQGAKRVFQQVMWMAGALTLGATVLSVVAMFRA
jgi:hypothetical protein